jgi:surface polysaccharide O-acyltransferase-like enzyme
VRRTLDQEVGSSHYSVDLIRTVAIILVILLHATIEPVPISHQVTQEEAVRWLAVNTYNSLSRPCVPLFIMLSGALLLQSNKINEPLQVFFKKRANRIAFPFIFWGATYFAWRFFVNGENLSANSIIQGILTGPYFHFWFLYALIGLYLATPAIRIIVGYARRNVIRYFIIIWFIGTALVPLLGLFTSYTLNANVAIFTGWIGYFVLGAYLTKIHLRPLRLYLVMTLGFAYTLIGTYLATAYIGGSESLFFYDYFSVNVVMASAAIFLLLLRAPANSSHNQSTRTKGFLHLVSKNTLPIYLFHIMIMESLQKGYFGFKISLTTINPLIEIPLIASITFLTTLGIIYILKKIPRMSQLLG